MLPLEGLEHFSLDGVEYEAFNTSGGLGTLCETLSGKVRNLDYKACVTHPSRADAVFAVRAAPGERSGSAQDIMRKSVPTTMQDVVLVFVTVSGMRGGAYVQEVFARKILPARQRSGRGSLGHTDHHRRWHLRCG